MKNVLCDREGYRKKLSVSVYGIMSCRVWENFGFCAVLSAAEPVVCY